MFKIAIIRRAGIDPLFRIYQEADSETGEMVEWSTDIETELEDKIVELLQTIPANQIKPIKDISYVLEVILNGV